MKKIHILILSFVMLLALQGVSLAQDLAVPGAKPVVVPGTLYVKFSPAEVVDLSRISRSRTGVKEVDELLEKIGATRLVKFDPDPTPDKVALKYGFDRMYSVNFSGEYTPYQVADMFASLPSVREVTPRFVFYQAYTPNDEHLNAQWYIDKMSVKQAWNATKGDSTVVIAILDDGINYNHEDLVPNIATNPGEMGNDSQGNDKRSNNKDDDKDGYVDNWRGWDFIESGQWDDPDSWVPDNDPLPPLANNSHGTKVAGCASARADNSIGLAGVGFRCKIMPIKTADNTGTLAAGYDAIYYASRKGAKIINCSWGGELDPKYVASAQSFVDAATERGSLVVASAGNYAKDNDITPFYPACLKDVLAVGWTDADDKANSNSHYGKSVDVFAPGSNILTVGYPGNDSYDPSFGGSSAAAPVTSGVAGLLVSKYPNWTPKFITRQLVETCDNVVNPSNRTKYWGRVNAYSAVSLPSYPGLVLIADSYKIDGDELVGLDYINKKYQLEVDFKNVVAGGAGITVTLLNGQSYYTANSPTVSTLGSMTELETKTGTFYFTRGTAVRKRTFAPFQKYVHLYFYATDGKKYKDTLTLDVDINADETWIDESVKEPAELGLKVGNLFPNPAHEKVSLPLQVSEQGEYVLSVKDMLGREVYRISEKVFTTGTHYIDIDTKSFANGMYIVTLLANGSVVRAGEFTVVK